MFSIIIASASIYTGWTMEGTPPRSYLVGRDHIVGTEQARVSLFWWLVNHAQVAAADAVQVVTRRNYRQGF
jgi:hypothetical protein